jgi:hypothetical protein
MGKALFLPYPQREEIARKLFQVRSVRGSELHGLCPYHEDSNPSFSYNVEKDVFNCLACGAGGDLIKLWSKAAGSGNLTDDFKAFCRQYGIELEGRGASQTNDGRVKKKKPGSCEDQPVQPSDLSRAWAGMDPLPDSWKEKLKSARGWSDDVMERLDLRVQSWRWDKRIGELKKVDAPERIAIPVFDIDGNLVNIRCYKPGGGANKIFSFGPGCGRARLFPARPTGDGIVLVTEGEADGYKVSRQSVYNAAKKGKLAVQADGTITESDALAYAARYLKKVAGKNGKPDKLAEERAAEELALIRTKRERMDFEFAKDRGLYILKSDVRAEIAIKIAALDATT